MMLENLHTDRLRFRGLQENDLPKLLHSFSDPVANQYLSIEKNKEDFTEIWLQRQWRRYEKGMGGLHAIELRSTGELVGQCGLIWQFVDCIPKWEVGYHFFRPFWGNGYATEAALACRDFCFENEMAETLISLIHPDNEKSKAVAKRTGLTFWKETQFKGKQIEVYKIIRPVWESLSNS